MYIYTRVFFNGKKYLSIQRNHDYCTFYIMRFSLSRDAKNPPIIVPYYLDYIT